MNELPYVTMTAVFILTIEEEMPDNPSNLSIGSFRLSCNINGDAVSVPFDFEATQYFNTEVTDNTATVWFETGKGLIYDDPHLSTVFDNEIKNDTDGKYSTKDFTAEILANTSEIEYFGVEPNADWNFSKLELKLLSFCDSKKEYEVSKEVLDKFNKCNEDPSYYM